MRTAAVSTGGELAPVVACGVGNEQPQSPVVFGCHADTLGARSAHDNGCAHHESKRVRVGCGRATAGA